MFKGKALYQPQGRSGEYAKWAINFYNGCTGGCEYCYNKRFPLLSNTIPTLKACFKDNDDALKTAVKEIQKNKEEIIRDGGIFLSFVSDPCLPETISLTNAIIQYCSAPYQFEILKKEESNSYEILKNLQDVCELEIPVIILTKRADWILKKDLPQYKDINRYIDYDDNLHKNVAFGFTLTGHDEMEPGCSSNIDRIRAMKVLHNKGYRTWASIEPIIDFDASLEMIRLAAPFCDHFKVGIRTDKKFTCSDKERRKFEYEFAIETLKTGSTVYFKHSYLDNVVGGTLLGDNIWHDGCNMFTGDRGKERFLKENSIFSK